jgi:hypothetical protein
MKVGIPPSPSPLFLRTCQTVKFKKKLKQLTRWEVGVYKYLVEPAHKLNIQAF